jgi:hypothetical protein
MGKGGSKTDKHGIRLIKGACSMHELFEEEPPPEKPLVSVGFPVTLQGRFQMARNWHYPTKVLFKLQDGKCFFCGEGMDNTSYTPSTPKGYRKCCLFPRERAFVLWGNKVLAHAACDLQHRGQMPPQIHLAKFTFLYSRNRFKQVFPEEAKKLAQEGW